MHTTLLASKSLEGGAEVSLLVANAHNSPGGCCLRVWMQQGVPGLQWTTKWCSQECGKVLKATRDRSATSLRQSTHPPSSLVLHTHPFWESHMSYCSRTCWIIEADRTCPKPQSLLLSFSLTNTLLAINDCIPGLGGMDGIMTNPIRHSFRCCKHMIEITEKGCWHRSTAGGPVGWLDIFYFTL